MQNLKRKYQKNISEKVRLCLPIKIHLLQKDFWDITYGDGYEYVNENNEVIYKFSDVGENWKNQQVCLQVNTSILESALKENSYKLFWVFRVYRSPSNKAYELYGNQICHDTDRSFVVWFDEEECKYIELKEIKPIRPNTYDDYELNIKILYGDAED